MYTLTNFNSNDVSVIDSVTNIVTKTIDVGPGPWDLGYNPSNKRIYSANLWSDDVSVIGSSTIIIGPAPNAGLDLKVESGTIVQLDGDSSISSNSSEGTLTYKWTQTEGPGVTLNNPSSPNPTFIAPIMVDQSEITFSLVVTNEEGITSEPDEVKITVYPTRSTISEEDNSKTINDSIKRIIKNPLNVSNSIDSANKIRDVLPDRQ